VLDHLNIVKIGASRLALPNVWDEATLRCQETGLDHHQSTNLLA